MSTDFLTSYKPTGRLGKKHLLSLMDYSREEIAEILHLALALKREARRGKFKPLLKDKTLAMIFAKSSTRTRVSFEQGIKQLGGTPLFLSSSDIQLGRGETISDTAKTLARFNIDGIMIRTFRQSDVVELAEAGNGAFSVINGLTDDFHPCQALADILTAYEVFGRLEGIKLVFAGEGNNVAHSLILAGAKMGMDVVCVSPQGYEPRPEVVAEAQKFGKATVTSDLESAVAGAHIIYTDVFFSMGQTQDPAKLAAFTPYRVTAEHFKKADPKAVFMHCLPAHRGEEVAAEVIDGPQSVVFEEAENRLHAQKAVMSLLMRK
ncbi:MAG: ornithine carbamoyltransferase [Clostridiales bacterium]|jgi:ornithine carbamoyltransferase|nr:ornithine carbamoyltransferase [Clostridiales bacterium]